LSDIAFYFLMIAIAVTGLGMMFGGGSD